MFRDLARSDWTGFDDISQVLRMMDEMMGGLGFADVRSAPLGSFPKVNVGETDDTVNVYAFAPGVDHNDLELSVEGNTLVIHGKRQLDTDATEKQKTWYRQERFNGEFTRAVSLPEYVDPEQIEARLKDGVLTVQLRKREEVQPRRIEIKAA